MRYISPESTGSVALILTIPQILHIDFPFLLSTFEEDAVAAEIHLDITKHFAAFEYRLTRTSERVGIHGKYSPEVAIFHSHPKQFTAHEAVVEFQISVFNAHHYDILVTLISNCS